MAEELQERNSGEQSYKLRLGTAGFFLAGLFLLAVGAGLFFFKNQSSPDDIQIISPQRGGAGQTAEIVVHMDGAVAKPGIYKLTEGSRVTDAVAAAGGLLDVADQSRVNLAARLADGQKINVPTQNSNVKSQNYGSEESSSLVNINTASEGELDKLPGIGPVTAQKIIAGRPYSSSEDLLTKKVVSKSVWEKIRDLITY